MCEPNLSHQDVAQNVGLMPKRFIIFVIDHSTASATSSEMAAIDAFNDRLRQEGHWLFAAGLVAPTESLLIDNTQHPAVVDNRSWFAGSEHYSGFWLVQCEDAEQAQQLAREGSRACHRKVELRALLG